METMQRNTLEDVRKIPKEVLAEVDLMLDDCSYTYKNISDWLFNRGYAISRGALISYKLQRDKEASEIKGTSSNTGVD